MIGEVISTFCVGTAFGFSLGSPFEWKIHKDLLHAPPTLRRLHPFIDAAARGHNDNHHGAYLAPEHYYRDVTNEYEIIHFARSDVGIIAGTATLFGTAMDRLGKSLAQSNSFDAKDAGFIAGFLTGTMTYYGCYEFFHHYMHVIGKRRLAINRVLGDTIQGGTENRDGNLRLSKPLLDDICTATEARIDQSLRQKKLLPNIAYAPPLVQRLRGQIQENIASDLTREKTAIVVHAEQGIEALAETYQTLVEQELAFFGNLSVHERVIYTIQRALQKHFRTSPLFRYMDNHHFVHHLRYGKNLNVLVPLMDYLKGTKANSTIATLEANKDYWLCPNSPDVRRFERKKAA